MSVVWFRPSMAQPIQRVAVVGAGNMGSGIAQKSAQEEFDVQMVDRELQWVERTIDHRELPRRSRGTSYLLTRTSRSHPRPDFRRRGC